VRRIQAGRGYRQCLSTFGIDVHRKRSSGGGPTEDGTVQLNKNVVNGSRRLLRLIGDCPSGTPVANSRPRSAGAGCRPAGGLRLRGTPCAPLRCQGPSSASLKNYKVNAAILAQLLRAGPAPVGVDPLARSPQVRHLRAVLRHRPALAAGYSFCWQPYPRGGCRSRL